MGLDIERRRAWRREWYAKNRDTINATSREKYHTDPGRRTRIAASSKKWRQANREKTNATQRAWAAANRDRRASYSRKHRYGVTLERYNEMVAEQDGRCGICGTDKPGGFGSRLHVDHDHETGKIRGLLCMRCNTSLATFEAHGSAMLDYLMRHAPEVA